MPKVHVDMLTTEFGTRGPALIRLIHDEPGDTESTSVVIDGEEVNASEIAVCLCGQTSNANGTCDGSHNA